MTEKKKRGLLSWLGFGEEEQSPKTQNEANVENVEDQTEVESQVEAEQVAPEAEQAKPIESKSVEPEQALEEIQQEQQPVEVEAEQEEVAAPQAKVEEVQEKPTESFFARLKRSLSRTKANIGAGFFGLFKGKQIDEDLFEELEEQLLIADVGMNTTVKIIENLTEKASRNDLKDGEALYGLLKEEMADILSQVEQPLVVDTTKTPYVILMVGVNGVGKTTTIGKLAKQFQGEGKKVMLAAGDTFRAAAVEQLQVWGQRNDVPVIAQHTGADSASVIYDAIEAAKARGVDVVIADTAGRLQNKSNLMEELRKIVRVMKKIDDSAPHEIMLTLDAGTGQNAISQAKLFSEVAPVTGITLTKLDGTAKGGVIFSIADQFQIPIRYIGVGEGIDDLRPFESKDFIEALFSREE
ncbi:signal recognition particle-docking protein FtsY [Vibrio cyclitrophicus]|uniref:signal recognition particle-docking protein FtsY n=1 Tax=Vibrio TaxID=662 RepID=UPI000307A212|nr:MULTISPECIES: signal recognition particle-docking protein FtsY [Vibrio]KAA8596391.1 Signal recognition particle receptor FtsY [Vibrio cyclitrophicus]MDH5881434.1 signal recognition particle-docking protein FtsY [Vibrio sp. S/42/10]NOH21333.1 signal recognition particle-docking protein FtsY [Vibrio cyclitrophicus]OBT26684.1 signal recognition particle-docking protein FtsY [Vibrio cyclitrophicus]OCH56567.1 signal recognition particle-docking protein FtsY [Vibrio cyclitrophicus]